MAYLAIDEATRFTGAWKSFNSGMKNWAYRQDQLVTTHPIAGQVADTDETFLNFDGITYGKGASALQQLVAYIGLERFRDGMRRYFQRYAFGNATLRDFLAALEEGSGRDLQVWSRLWLETPSLNTLATTWESDGERLTSLTLTQTAPPDYPTLRPHHVEVALVRDENGVPTVESLPAEIDGAEAGVAAARGRNAPDLVFPNHGDQTFAKIALDAHSVDYVRANLDRIDDPLLRQLLWSSLWTMVRDRHLKSTDYLALVRAKVVLEPDLELMETTLGYAGAALAVYVPESRREAEAHAFFETAWQALQSAPQGDAQIIWARALIAAAILPEDLTHVARLADAEIAVPGLTVDQQMRWDIAARFIARGLDGAEARLAAERARDPSDRGQRAALRAEASRPAAEAKAEVWDRVHGDGYGSLHLTGAAMSGFNWNIQRALLEPYVEAFFTRVPEIFENRTREFASVYFGNLYPGYRVEQPVLDRSERLLADTGERLPVLARMLRESNDDLARAIAVRAYAES
jgi:aminopeptidase N